MEELNALFQEKCRKYLSHQIRGKEANVGFMLAQEKEYLYPLPKSIPLTPAREVPVVWIVFAPFALTAITTLSPVKCAAERSP